MADGTDRHDPGAVVRAALDRLAHAGDPSALFDPAVDTAAARTAAADGVEPGTPDRLAVAWYLWARCRAGSGPIAHDDLQAAAALFAPVPAAHRPTELADVVAAADPLWQAHDVALTLLPLALRTRSADLADRCVRLLQVCLDGVTVVTDRRVVLSNLGKALHDRYAVTGDEADQDASLAAVRESVRLTPEDSPYRASRCTNLVLALRERHERTGDSADLHEAATWADEALACAPPEGLERARIIGNVAPVHSTRFEATGERADLDRAAALLATAVDGDDPGLAGRLTNLAETLRMRGEHTGDVADLDAAVDAAREAVRRYRNPLMVANLSVALRTRHQRTGRGDDLAEAVATARDALAATAADDPDRGLRQSGLALALGAVAAAPDTADAARDAALDEAVALARTARGALPDGHPLRGRRKANLGSLLLARHQRTGGQADLDEAVAALEGALDALQAGHVDRAAVHANLDVALLARFTRAGDPDDLDRAVAQARAAVAATPPGHLDRPGRLSNLALASTERHDLFGAAADLETAVSAIRSAAADTADDDPFTAGALLNLSAVLRGVGERADDGHLIAEAVSVAERSVAAATAPDRPAALANLAGALVSRHVRSGSAADLDTAVAAARDAAAAGPPGSPATASYRVNLAALLVRRYDTRGDAADLAAAAETVAPVANGAGTRAPDRARALLEHGAVLRRIGTHTGDLAAAHRAVAAFRQAWAQTSAPTRLRVRAAAWWGECAAATGNAAEAERGYAAALDIAGLLAGPRLRRADHEHALAAIGGLSCDAAAAALDNGHAERAVELSEQGRGVLLSRALDGRPDLAALEHRRPGLARRFRMLRTLLDAPPVTADHSPDRAAADAAMAALLDEIRALPGHDRFLVPAGVDDLCRAAADGPVVIVNTARQRCDALVLTPDGVMVIPLPRLTTTEVAERARAWWTAVETIGTGGARPDERVLADTLAWLGDRVVRPVLARLPRVPDRIWWCPAGVLTYLPLHAVDLPPGMVCSLTPTVRALLIDRSRTAGLGSALVVGLRSTPRAADLPGAAAECAAVAASHSAAETLRDGDATRARLLDALPRHAVVHLACHAVADPDDPSTGRLLLRDQPLTVAEVTALHLPAAQLAVLSACATAAPAGALVDEAIHLASAFRAAGYPQVVGTIWPVPDPVAVRFSRVFHRLLARRGTADAVPAAWAGAVAALRERWPQHPSVWAAFAHLGAEPTARPAPR